MHFIISKINNFDAVLTTKQWLIFLYGIIVLYLWSEFHFLSDEFDFVFITSRFFIDDARRMVTNSYCEFHSTQAIPYTAYPAAVALSVLSKIENFGTFRILGLIIALGSFLPFIHAVKIHDNNFIVLFFVMVTLGYLPVSLILFRGEWALHMFISIFALLNLTRINSGVSTRVWVSIILLLFYISTYIHPKTFYFLPLAFSLVFYFKSRTTRMYLLSFFILHVFFYLPFIVELTSTCRNVPVRHEILQNMTINPGLLFSDFFNFFYEIWNNWRPNKVENLLAKVELISSPTNTLFPPTSESVYLQFNRLFLNFTMKFCLIILLLSSVISSVIVVKKFLQSSSHKNLNLVLLCAGIFSIIVLNKSQQIYDISLAVFLMSIFTLVVLYNNSGVRFINYIIKSKWLDGLLGVIVMVLTLSNIVYISFDIQKPFSQGWEGGGAHLAQPTGVYEGRELLQKCLGKKKISDARVILSARSYEAAKNSVDPMLVNWLMFYMTEDGIFEGEQNLPADERKFSEVTSYAEKKEIDAIFLRCTEFGDYSVNNKILKSNSEFEGYCCLRLD